jgi:hypothetical protein
MFDAQAHGVITHVGYRDLERIFVLTLPPDEIFKSLKGKTLVLALITPWDTEGKSAAEENVFMTSQKAKIVTDVRSIQAVVGLVETRNRWGIIDQAYGMVETQFTTGIGEGTGRIENDDDDDVIC